MHIPWDVNDYSAIRYCSGIAGSIHFEIDQDNEIIAQMEMLYKLELLSWEHGIELREYPLQHLSDKYFMYSMDGLRCSSFLRNEY